MSTIQSKVDNSMKNSHDLIKRDGPPASASSERPAKRSKQPINETVHLPAEMWAAVMNHLDFSSVLSMTATARTMRDAAPFVTELHVNKSSQMHASVGRRFSNVQTIYIYTLIQQMKDDFYNSDDDFDEEEEDDDDDLEQDVDFETTVRAVPFIVAFANLKKIYFGGISVSNDWLYSVVPYLQLNFHDDYSFEEEISRLNDSISAGYRCGTLPPSLEVKGLICPQTFRDHNALCGVCLRACESFPVKSVAEFDCINSPYDLGFSDDGHDNFFYLSCVSRRALMRILEKRPGGRNALCSKRPLLETLGRCTRDRLGRFQGKDIWVLNFSVDMQNSLKRTIDKSNLDGTDLEPSEISDALLTAFPTNEMYEYILSGSARKCLRDLNMQIDDNMFGSSHYLLNLARELLPQIVKTHFRLEQCVYLLERLVSDVEPPFKDIIDSGVTPYLVKGIERAAFEPEYSASCIRVLSKLLQSMNVDQVKEVVDFSFLEAFDFYYGFARMAMRMPQNAFEDSCKLFEYVVATSVELRDSVLKSGILTNLSDLMVNRNGSIRSSCTEIWKTICSSYKDSSPIDFSLVNIEVDRMAPLLTSRNDELVEFVGSVLSLHVKNVRLSGEILVQSFSSYAVPIKDLIQSFSSRKTFVHALRVFSLLTELDFFGSIANELDSTSIDSLFGAIKTILEIAPRSTEDEIMVKQACKCFGHLVMAVLCKPSSGHHNVIMAYQPGRYGYHRIEHCILPWIKTLVKVSNDGCHLTVLQQKLLRLISNTIHNSDSSLRNECHSLERDLGSLTFAELTRLLKLGSAGRDVEDELRSSLQNKIRIYGPIEEKIKTFLATSVAKEELYDDDEFLTENDDGNFILTNEEINSIAAMLPLTTSELSRCGISGDICRKYGEKLLRITAVYSDAKNVHKYHHRGVMSILVDCAAQIPVE